MGWNTIIWKAKDVYLQNAFTGFEWWKEFQRISHGDLSSQSCIRYGFSLTLFKASYGSQGSVPIVFRNVQSK